MTFAMNEMKWKRNNFKRFRKPT